VRLREFAELMNAISVPQGRLIAEAFDFAPYRCIMDVAGGPGSQSIEIGLTTRICAGSSWTWNRCASWPESRLPPKAVRPLHGDPWRLITGPYPPGADVILLGHILHDWSDDTCRRILRHIGSGPA
jgi:hypothetical protein